MPNYFFFNVKIVFLNFVLLKALPVNSPFTCDFDTFSQVGTTACHGISFDETTSARISSVETQLLPGTTNKYITDFTSIGMMLFF